MNKLVNIRVFETLGSDDRGVTCKFSLPRKQQDFIFLTRKSGSVSGNTYHEGKNEGTAPKTFVLISGKIVFSYRQVKTHKVISEEVVAPAIIEVEPMVTHTVKAITDICILECNSINDIQNDRIHESVELPITS
ncbi:polysaccharide biosynthesis C-terminal domain-containing protein [Cysteiniphilum halobium]|uniref:polysaccharide biosynthesis C-terminal domain-containing protein n=1 Tax=Cysteiniphilum halobium TaxID=2219059 RepID=UPI003F8465E5